MLLSFRVELLADQAMNKLDENPFSAFALFHAFRQGAKEEFVRVPYGASHEDVAAINDWHTMAAEALSEWENQA